MAVRWCRTPAVWDHLGDPPAAVRLGLHRHLRPAGVVNGHWYLPSDGEGLSPETVGGSPRARPR